MGGTTAKASVIEAGAITRAGEFEIGGVVSQGSRLNKGSGFLLRVPAIDIAEVGAGGGSIVTIDDAGAIHVGPRSAGATPGPVCYDAGGTDVTLTDANVCLGYLHPERLPSGLRLNPEKSRRAVADQVASRLGLSLEDAAYGVYLLGCAGMARAVRAVTIERGRDPRDFVLVAFGGNGPLFAAEMARELAETFGREHERTYGHRADADPIQLVNLRVTARMPRQGGAAAVRAGAGRAGAGGERLAYFGAAHGALRTPVLARGDLGAV